MAEPKNTIEFVSTFGNGTKVEVGIETGMSVADFLESQGIALSGCSMRLAIPGQPTITLSEQDAQNVGLVNGARLNAAPKNIVGH